MFYILAKYFLLFILFSFFGWCMEVVVTLSTTKKLVNRGFLVGPVCPIYGCGGVLLTLLLRKYISDALVLFVMSLIICSVLEYFTSYLMEKMFKARWWDYSKKKFHVNGRICLENCIAFGLLGLFIVKFVTPFFSGIIDNSPRIVIWILFYSILTVFVVDNIVSFKIISSFKKTARSIHKDSTAEITKKVKEILVSRGGLYKRLVSAFNFEASEKLLLEIQNKVATTVKKAQEFANDSKEKVSKMIKDIDIPLIDDKKKKKK
ncbi:MAG: putative ABC transporter permease [Bacilli bacterium]|nr:putative ABC transporter permease [Bacilli bacterium]